MLLSALAPFSGRRQSAPNGGRLLDAPSTTVGLPAAAVLRAGGPWPRAPWLCLSEAT